MKKLSKFGAAIGIATTIAGGGVSLATADSASAATNHIYVHESLGYANKSVCLNTLRGVENNIAAHHGVVKGEGGNGGCWSVSGKWYYGGVLYNSPSKVWGNDLQLSSYSEWYSWLSAG